MHPHRQTRPPSIGETATASGWVPGGRGASALGTTVSPRQRLGARNWRPGMDGGGGREDRRRRERLSRAQPVPLNTHASAAMRVRVSLLLKDFSCVWGLWGMQGEGRLMRCEPTMGCVPGLMAWCDFKRVHGRNNVWLCACV